MTFWHKTVAVIVGMGLGCALAQAEEAALAAAKPEVLATFKGGQLDTLDWQVFLNRIPAAKREGAANLQQVTMILENTMVYRMLAQEARGMGLDKDPAIAREVQQMVEQVLGRRRLDAFRDSLKKPDFTAAAEEYYKLNQKEFLIPEQYHVAHILLTPKEGRDDSETRKLAEKLRERALKGEDFYKLAGEFSDDPSVKNNQGDLGDMPRGRLVKPFEDAALALKKRGDISPVVKTQFGYHVIKFYDHQPERQRSFADVKQELLQKQEEKFVKEEEALFIARHRQDSSIEKNEDAIRGLLK